MRVEPQPATLASCVIPCLNEASTIGACLRQFERLPGSWELIVADSGSVDETRHIASATPGVRLVAAPRGRGAGMNAGAASASGDILIFLHADTLLPIDAWQLIVDALADTRVSAVAFHLRLDRPELRYRFVSLASRIRMPIQRTFFGDQAIAVRRADFEAIGGFRELALMEDIDLSRRLRKSGRLATLPAHVTTSARRFQRHGVVRTLLFMTGLQIAYSLGVPAERLARRYAAVR
ncbi:MAG TPA: TIGR04283 family arsenosugar biosynthesis glycosyltransferase [Thermomicrobiales bacterium]|nr:TIGR04283 family arsenosugar biosynthesis glycosyltransferase [Thermomicrobiales bacterium]